MLNVLLHSEALYNNKECILGYCYFWCISNTRILWFLGCLSKKKKWRLRFTKISGFYEDIIYREANLFFMFNYNNCYVSKPGFHALITSLEGKNTHGWQTYHRNQHTLSYLNKQTTYIPLLLNIIIDIDKELKLTKYIICYHVISHWEL